MLSLRDNTDVFTHSQKYHRIFLTVGEMNGCPAG